jgi:AcrR family transcriptional regulator
MIQFVASGDRTAAANGAARPLRADAVRNRERILAAAREQITLHGPDVPMESIATAAGVAVGTLYRHYPTKTELVGAILSEHVETMIADIEAAADRVDAGAAPTDEILALVERQVEAAADDNAVKAAAAALGTGYPEALQTRGFAGMNRLIAAATSEGRLKPDVTAEDFYLLLMTAPTDQPRPVRRRWLDLMLPGFLADPR